MRSKNKKNTIIWQKWQDPFGEKDDSIDLDEEYSNFFDEESGEEGIIDFEEQKSKLNEILNNKQIKVIATPMGIVPINENTASGKIFNFWVGHTNFNITKNIASLIEEADGVETLDIFTRYRFRISVGKAFNDSSVMKSIQESIYHYIETINNDQED
jgi:hypothetical protein